MLNECATVEKSISSVFIPFAHDTMSFATQKKIIKSDIFHKKLDENVKNAKNELFTSLRYVEEQMYFYCSLLKILCW